MILLIIHPVLKSNKECHSGYRDGPRCGTLQRTSGTVSHRMKSHQPYTQSLPLVLLRIAAALTTKRKVNACGSGRKQGDAHPAV